MWASRVAATVFIQLLGGRAASLFLPQKTRDDDLRNKSWKSLISSQITILNVRKHRDPVLMEISFIAIICQIKNP